MRLVAQSSLLWVLAVWPCLGWAQSLKIEPAVSSRLSYSDNTRLLGDRTSDWALTVQPSIRMESRGGRFVGRLDYAIEGVTHSQSDVATRTFNTLNANGTLTAVENFLFVDARAGVSGENFSVFGPQAGDNTTGSTNRAQVRSLGVSPYLRGQLGASVAYSLRLDWSTLDSDAPGFSRTENQRISAGLNGRFAGTRLSWVLSADSSVNHTRQYQDLRDELLRARLVYDPLPDVQVFGSVGREGFNYVAGESSRRTTGLGASWSPQSRTRVSWERENRFFGSYQAASVSHRHARWAVNLNYSRDIASSTQQVFSAGNGNVLQTLFDLYTTRIPDPFERLVAVVNFLNQSGIPPFLTRPFAFYARQPFVDRRVQGTAVWLGGRNTLALGVFRSQREALDVGYALVDDFAFGRRIATRGASMDWTHNLAGNVTVNGNLAHNQARAEDGSASSKANVASVGVQSSVTPRTQAFGTLRHTRGESTGEYRENAAFVGVRVNF